MPNDLSWTPGPTAHELRREMAVMMSGAGPMVAPMFRGNLAACYALIQFLEPYGLNPVAVSWKVHPSMEPGAPWSLETQVLVAILASVEAAPGGLQYDYEGEGGERRVTVWGITRDNVLLEITTPRIREIRHRQTALWVDDPDQALAYLGARVWIRRHKPELLLGIYDKDEMDAALRARDVTPTSNLQRMIQQAERDGISVPGPLQSFLPREA